MAHEETQQVNDQNPYADAFRETVNEMEDK